MFDESEYSDKDPYDYFREAYDLQLKGRVDEAIELYLKSIDMHPTAEAHTYLGWAYSFKKDYARAIEECKRAIDIDPELGNPYNDIGAYYIELGDLDEAVFWLEKALESIRYDSFCYPHYNLGRVWEKRGDLVRALRSYQNAFLSNSEYSIAEKAIQRIQALMN